ncbi:MAG: Transglutaminase family protein [Candidatus Hydrogenedentes bacterium]|nr:Transglutaminase family protein [Candidatus Hydrogenedentota bacterium]
MRSMDNNERKAAFLARNRHARTSSRAVWRIALMVSLSLFPRLLVAHELDVASLVGEDWYGLYLNGQKAGYSMNAVRIEADGTVLVVEDARFQINMVGVRQDMQIFSERAYGPDGSLVRIDYRVVDPAGTKEFHAKIEGAEMLLTSIVGGSPSEQRLPKPNESLDDVLKQARLVGPDAKVGDSITFSVFDPMYQKEIGGKSEIVGVENRMFDGAPTMVFKVKSHLDLMGIDSMAFVAQDGTVLEDEVASIITMRIEPEIMAKDVNYNNDVIVSNAAMVDAPIANARSLDTLKLWLDGPLAAVHLFNDERQTMAAQGSRVLFTGKKIVLDKFESARLPIENEAVEQWLKPTLFVQSDDPKLIEKAKEIAGDEKDAVKVSNLLCTWVNRNVRTSFSAQLTNALEVLERLEGDCTEYSILFIGLARAAGLPAREVAGLIYMEGTQPGFYFHQWAKVWVGKWIDVDPTFNQPIADVTHIKLAEGDLFEQARLIPIIGRIQIHVATDGDGS